MKERDKDRRKKRDKEYIQLSIDKVSVSFQKDGDNFPVLQDVSLQVKRGEFTALLGPSGSGKSTLLRVAAGLIQPHSGRVLMSDSEVVRNRLKVGYMPQNDLLLPWKTLIQNGALPLLAAGEKKSIAYQKVTEWLPVFGLDGFENAYPSELSGGMRQRAALLRTFLIDSRIMLLDEPFASLDAITRVRMQEWLLDVWEKFRRSVLFVTHSIDEAIYLADRIYVISQCPGRNVFEQKIEIPRPRLQEIITYPLFNDYKELLMLALK